MKFDTKSLIEYDYNLYHTEYARIKKELNNNDTKSSDNLNKNDLKLWLEKGLFVRKLKFRKSAEFFYITTAPISRGYGYTHDLKFQNDYIISYWDKQRVEALMKFDINSKSPANGKVDLIGDYVPVDDNLTKIKYETGSSKDYIHNAKLFLEGKEEIFDEDEKVDISSFFRLNFELAGQGIQSRALYETENCIIEGMAGTGKSTIALQKLKYFLENYSILQNEMIVLVKNYELKSHFSTLLNNQNINLEEVKISVYRELFDSNYSKEHFLDFRNKADKFKRDINESIDKRDIDSLSIHYSHIINYIGLSEFKMLLKQKIDYLNSDGIIKIKFKSLTEEIEKLNNQLIESKIDENKKLEIMKAIKVKLKEQNKYNPERYSRIYEKLTTVNYPLSASLISELIESENNYTKELTILKWVLEYKNFQINHKKLEDKIEKLTNENLAIKNDEKKINIKNKIESLVEIKNKKNPYANRKDIDRYKSLMKKVYFCEHYIRNNLLKNENNIEIQNIILRYMKILKNDYKLMIVDEAQDFQVEELEILRLNTDKIILTGDLLQNTTNEYGIKKWEDLLFYQDVYFKDDKLNKFDLKHNYRQTYQLANASFNFRNIILKRDCEDIGDDYFENEKRFNTIEYNKPELYSVKDNKTISNIIDETVNNLLKTYSSLFPVVIVCKNDDEKDFYKKDLSHWKVAEKIDNQADLILLSIAEIKGEQFPIVVANINNLTNKEIYLIMSRAQFELKLYTDNFYKIDKDFIKLLHKQDFIELRDINTESIPVLSEKQSDKDPKGFKTLVLTENLDISNSKLSFPEIESNAISSIVEDIVSNNNSILVDYCDNDNLRLNRQETIFDALIEEYDTHNNNIEQIESYNRNVEELEDIEIEPSLINNPEEFQEKYLANMEQKINDIINQIETVKPKIKRQNIARPKKLGDKETRDIFARKDWYFGQCQICGFTFKKQDGYNHFERFTWTDFKKGKWTEKQKNTIKHNIIDVGNSLCLCSRCHSIIKQGGDFEASFLKLLDKERFQSKSFDERIKKISTDNQLLENPKCFKDALEWQDMYSIPIRLNNKDEKIYFTEEHLITFFAFLES